MNWWPSMSTSPTVTNFLFSNPASNPVAAPVPSSRAHSPPHFHSNTFLPSPHRLHSRHASPPPPPQIQHEHASTKAAPSSRMAFSWVSESMQRMKQWLDPLFYPTLGQAHFEQLLKTASTYDQWSAAASIVDQMEGRDTWKQKPESDLYDYRLVQDRYRALLEAREAKDIHRLIFLLRTSLSRNLGGIGNPKLYGVCKVGTKSLIEDYISEVVKCLDIVCSDSLTPLSHRERMEFFLNTRQSFGRSALLLSGGATLALHHIGVIKCLWECKLLPRIISGASGGSIIASFICTHTEQEFPMMFNPAYVKMNFFDRDAGLKGLGEVLKTLFATGAMFNIDTLIKTVRTMFGDMTFLEAYNRSRRILNITVSSSTVYEMPRLLNYLTAPNVYIWSAVAASCSVPLIFQAAPLMAKDKSGKAVPWNPSGHRWIDGSVESDLPMQKLSELFNVNHFIVCQVNPHVIPFLHKGLVKSRLRNACESVLTFSRNEFDLRCNQLRELGLLPELLYRVQSIVSQIYIGDITIIPEIQVSDYVNILNNPTSESYLEACIKGERATWPKITIMQNHLRIEMTIDEMLFKCRMREWSSNIALQSAKTLALQHYHGHQRTSSTKSRTQSTSQLVDMIHQNAQLSTRAQSLSHHKPLPLYPERIMSASLGDLTYIRKKSEERARQMAMQNDAWEPNTNGLDRLKSISDRHLEKTQEEGSESEGTAEELMFRVEGVTDPSLGVAPPPALCRLPPSPCTPTSGSPTTPTTVKFQVPSSSSSPTFPSTSHPFHAVFD